MFTSVNSLKILQSKLGNLSQSFVFVFGLCDQVSDNDY